MHKIIAMPLAAFNQAQKENDTCYRNYAKKAGLSDTAFWLLYSVVEREMPYTQKELCESWFFPPQTINSSLKDLVRKGIISFETVPDNRKNKLIILTENGKKLADDVIFPLIMAEQRSFERMGQDEYDRFLKMMQLHNSFLKDEIDKI